jgi:hypothetical protein
MYTTIPDLLRKQSVESLFSTQTFRSSWNHWQPYISSLLGTTLSESNILNLGDHLSRIFKLTGTAGRGQGELSAGGTVWESLVCWYINLCTVGSRIVAIKKMSTVPFPIQDAITVNYGNFGCNTESDITVIIFPDTPIYNTEILQLPAISRDNITIPPIRNGKLNSLYINTITEQDFPDFEIGIIQCKTNWNDNAQIPMLWDMIYSAGGFRGRNITVGKNGFSIQNAKRFTYAFVTVPSNQNVIFSSSSVAVKRVTNLSGGNFWGKETLPEVARSIKEIFTNNYIEGFRGSIRTDIRTALPFFENHQALSYFRIRT